MQIIDEGGRGRRAVEEYNEMGVKDGPEDHHNLDLVPIIDFHSWVGL